MMKRNFYLANVNTFYGRVGPQPCASIINKNASTVRQFGSSSSSSSSNYNNNQVMCGRFFKRSNNNTSVMNSSSTVCGGQLLMIPQIQSSSRHNFVTDLVGKVTGREKSETPQLQQLVYDKENVHYTGKIFGISTDTLFFYAKVGSIGLAVYLVVWTFFAGYQYLMSFSLAAVGKLGFMAGFWTSFILANTFAQLKRRYTISPNAVYNQAIALVLKDQHVRDFLGEYPKTGDFRAYHASGGFKLPIMRRIRSGSYELADLFGTKPQRLQMMFILRAQDREALVSCDVRKMHTRLFSSSYQFKSLAVHLKDKKSKEAESRILIGRDEDVIYQGIMQF